MQWLHKKISQSPDYILLGGILLFCLLYRIYYFHFLYPGFIAYNSDSVTYFTSVDIGRGVVDLYRTPLYSYVLKFFEYLSKENFIRNLIIFQQSVSLLSVIPFYFISRGIIRNKYLMLAETLFYGCWHPILDQNINMNPECLCIAGSTLILFLFVRYIQQPAKSTAMAIGILSFLLVMLKPTYLIMLFVVAVFWMIRFMVFREERPVLYWALLGWLIAVGGVLGYCGMNYKHNGEFVLSNIYLNNSLVHISMSGAYKQGGDQELISIIDAMIHDAKYESYYAIPFILNNDYIDNYLRCYKKFPQYLMPTGDMLFCFSIPDTVNYSLKRLDQFVATSQHTMVYLKYLLGRMMNVALAYGYLSILLLLESFILLYAFVKYKKTGWLQILCIFFVATQFFTLVVGGVDDLDRLLMPSYPFIIQLIASFGSVVISSFHKEKFIDSIL